MMPTLRPLLDSTPLDVLRDQPSSRWRHRRYKPPSTKQSRYHTADSQNQQPHNIFVTLRPRPSVRAPLSSR